MGDHKQIVKAMFEDLYGQGKLELIDTYCTDDYVLHDTFTGDKNKEDERQQVKFYRGAFPDLKCEVLDTLMDGDVCAIRWRAQGTNSGDFMNNKATGRKVEINGISSVKFQGDKICETWSQYDALGMLQQLGVVPPILKSEKAREGARPS